MKRLLTSIAVLLSLTAAALGQNRALPAPEIRGNDIVFGSVLKLGTRIGTTTTLTPDGLVVGGVNFNTKAPLASPTFTGVPTAPTFALDGAAGVNRLFSIRSGGVLRWAIGADIVAEGGSNAGSNFALYNYSDTGTYLSTALTVSRATGRATFGAGITAPSITLSGTGSTGDATNLSATAFGTGTISRSLADHFSTQVFAINFGVIPGAADSGPALRNAIAYTQGVGGRLILPPGVINVCGGTDGEALLRIETFMDLVGSSRRSRIEPCADAGNRTVLLVKPLMNGGGIRGAVLKDFTIGTPGVQRSYGGDAIKLDTTNKNGFIAKLTVENVGTSARTGYWGLNHVNVSTLDGNGAQLTGNLTGGLFASTFRDNDFIGGINFQLTGDSNNIERNIISGPNDGVVYQAIGGAATARIVGNNITATGDTIVLNGGQQIYVEQNQLEAVGTYTGSRTNPAVITVIGTLSVAIRDNNINAYTRSDAVNLSAGARGVSIADNTVNYAADKYLLRATGSPGNTVERQLYEGSGGANITGASRVLLDAASITVGVWQQLTTQNNWVAGSDANFRQGLWWMPLRDGGIRLSGVVTGGTTNPGTVIANFPVGFRPTGRAIRFPAMAYTANVAANGTAWGQGVFIVDGAGNINIQAVPTMAATGSFLQFDGANFNIRPQ